MSYTPPAPPEAPPEPEPLRSAHTPNFPALLEHLDCSLLISTYQAGKLVIVRADGGALNTHFRTFDKPMGLAWRGGRLAIGTALEIWEFHDAPAVAARLEPAGRHDACYLPRGSSTTGDVQIHEMAFDRSGELWFVNTRFSCLCTRSPDHSFVPRWRPPFVTSLAPDDRCHLNGLGMVDGAPRLLTALGETDTPGGWRAGKKSGGVLIDAASNRILSRGLSMPHSPRWHAGRIWLLESGAGSFGQVDPESGLYRPLAELPGFTRGLDFYGDYAFVGLSQVRESAFFGGLPITERLGDRACGVWVLDLATGSTVAFLRFEAAVQEIFAVQVLPGLRFPDLINQDRSWIADSFVLPPA